ncbi:hypothetical protein CFK37_18810 [Virgibacillus phasianinus]|uniref:Uncharacterized protein n=1 Tax=Virgibacillus phasianinus TaxID=2017483 RepID=A0A220U870_9BACI|nr:hypothetical protein CFK37_18810 [Virgibacillus phasianinus]
MPVVDVKQTDKLDATKPNCPLPVIIELEGKKELTKLNKQLSKVLSKKSNQVIRFTTGKTLNCLELEDR